MQDPILHATAGVNRRDFLRSLAALSVPSLCQVEAADAVAPTRGSPQVLVAIEKIQRGVPGMHPKCTYAPIQNPTHLLVVLRQMHEFGPAEALLKTAPTQGGMRPPNLELMRRELIQAAAFLKRDALLKDIFCEAVSADQLTELNMVVAELGTMPSPMQQQQLRRRLGADFFKCELIANSALSLHAAESRELNGVVSELNEKGLQLVNDAKRMFEIESYLKKQYPRRQDVPEDQHRLFLEAADRVTRTSDQYVAFWNDPETQRRIFDKRELFALDQISRRFSSNGPSGAATNSCPGAVLLYGGNHDFKRHLAKFQQDHPNLRIALIELTPQSYTESSGKIVRPRGYAPPSSPPKEQ